MAVNNPTTNYGWILPFIGGSIGAWGTLLNDVFGLDKDETIPGIDAVIGLVQIDLDTAQTEIDAIEVRLDIVEATGITPLFFQSQLASDQSIPFNVPTRAAWATEVFDQGDVISGPTVTLATGQGGLWYFHVNTSGESHSALLGDDSNAWTVEIRRNGVAIATSRSPHSNDGFSLSSGDVSLSCATIISASDGDTYEVFVTQADPGGGGAETLRSGVASYFEGVRLASGV